MLMAVSVGARTLAGLRRLRERGAVVAPLEHELVLEGHEPERRLVVLGDSAAAGHGLPDPETGLARSIARRLHADDGRTTHVVSVARDGATTADVRRDQLAAVGDATHAVLGVGANDALRGSSVARSASELEVLLSELVRTVGDRSRVVLVGCPDLSVAPGLPRAVRPLVGWRCRAIARGQARVAARLGVPLLPLPRRDLVPETFGPDGFHPGPVGHARMAEAVAAALAC
jgi:lysophospholipase L1-like esterase